MTETLRRTAFGALALLLGFIPLACASSSAVSPQTAAPEAARSQEMKKGMKKGEKPSHAPFVNHSSS